MWRSNVERNNWVAAAKFPKVNLEFKELINVNSDYHLASEDLINSNVNGTYGSVCIFWSSKMHWNLKRLGCMGRIHLMFFILWQIFRIAQELTSLAISLPLNLSSAIFVRTVSGQLGFHFPDIDLILIFVLLTMIVVLALNSIYLIHNFYCASCTMVIFYRIRLLSFLN